MTNILHTHKRKAIETIMKGSIQRLQSSNYEHVQRVEGNDAKKKIKSSVMSTSHNWQSQDWAQNDVRQIWKV